MCWICACAILHNLLLQDGYVYENLLRDPDMVHDPNEDDLETPATNDPHDRHKREVVKMEVLRFHRDIDS